MNKLTMEEAEALARGVNPMDGCGLPPFRKDVQFACDSCRQGLRPRGAIFTDWQGDREPATIFVIMEDILEGRCDGHYRYAKVKIPFKLGAEFLWWKFCLSDVLRS